MNPGQLLVFSGPSGSGKSTVCNHLLNKISDLAFSVSVTTRKQRGQEQDGVDYHFVSRDDFTARIKQGEFAEWAEVHGNFYGTLWSTIREGLAAGRHLLLDIDVQGGVQIKRQMPEAVLFFLMPPSLEVLRERLVRRGTDSAEVIERRVENARHEIEHSTDYDQIVINENLDETLRRVDELVTGILGK